MNSEMGHLSLDNLGTRVFLRKILLHFSNKELNTASLVSKLWNSEARSLMEKRGKLIAVLSPLSPCQDLMALVSDLEQMNAAPVSITGIHVQIGLCQCHGRLRQDPSNGLPGPNYDAILDRLKYRNLSISLNELKDSSMDCPVNQFVKKILGQKCARLVKISLEFSAIGNPRSLFIALDFQDCSFPNLKTLQIHAWRYELDFFKPIVCRAPALQIVYTSTYFLSEENILEGSSAVIVPIYQLNPVYDEQYSNSALDKTRLESVALEMFLRGKDVNMKRLDGIMPLLLKNSWSTLNSLRIELIFTISLMSYGVQLVNVRKLNISLPNTEFFDSYGPEALQLIKTFNFTHVLPNLSSVEIGMFFLSNDGGKISADLQKQFIKQGNGKMWEYRPDRASKVKQLSFHRVQLLACRTVRFFAEMMPNYPKTFNGVVQKGQNS